MLWIKISITLIASALLFHMLDLDLEKDINEKSFYLKSGEGSQQDQARKDTFVKEIDRLLSLHRMLFHLKYIITIITILAMMIG